MRRQPVTLATSREPVARQSRLSASWYQGIDSDKAFNCRAAVGKREGCLLWAAFAAKERARQPSAPLTEALLSPYLGGIAPHVPALGKPILPISPHVPRPADLHPKIAVDLNALDTVLARRNVPSLPVPITTHLVDAETKHPIRKDVDDMRCTPRKTAGEWSPQDGV